MTAATAAPKRAYTFKQGLAMMAAKEAGIDPYLAAEAGDDARAILANLRKAKTAKGAEKAKHLAAAQSELRKLSPRQHGNLISALQAKLLALQGQGGDTAVAHLEPGEMVIPRHLLTPELARLIAAEAAQRGIRPEQLIVGGRGASINPHTGAEEFGLFDTIKGWFGGAKDELDMTGVGPVTVSKRNEVLIDPITVAAHHQPSWLGAISGDAQRSADDQVRDLTKGMIREFEGYKLKKYIAPEGKVTSGYGHVHPTDTEKNDGEAITPAEAESNYETDYKNLQQSLTDPRLRKLEPYQRAAVNSLAYNIGVDRFKKSQTYKYLLDGDYSSMDKEWREWRMITKPDGTKQVLPSLERRRRAELDMFNGRYKGPGS